MHLHFQHLNIKTTLGQRNSIIGWEDARGRFELTTKMSSNSHQTQPSQSNLKIP